MTDTDRLERAHNIVRNAPWRHRELGELVTRPGGGGYRERVTTSKVDADLPVNETAIDLQRDMIDLLASWAECAADEASLGCGVGRSPIPLTAFLLNAWRWVEAAEWADDLADEFIELARRVDAAITPPERTPIADRIHDGLIDGRDVAMVTGVSPSMVRQWVASRELVARERGPNGRNLYDIDDVRSLKARRDIRFGNIVIDDTPTQSVPRINI